jgi:hypothetical protein
MEHAILHDERGYGYVECTCGKGFKNIKACANHIIEEGRKVKKDLIGNILSKF